MSGIKQPILDVMTRLGLLTDFKTIRIWNNQIKSIRDQKGYDFLFPALFVEVQSPTEYNNIGLAFSEADLVFVLHVVHEFYDAQDGTMEQDLIIFGLRDEVIKQLQNFQPTACSNMDRVSETAAYDHDNIYEYLISFKCSFIDSKGSPYDTGNPTYIASTPPTLETTTVSQGLVPYIPQNTTYVIPQS